MTNEEIMKMNWQLQAENDILNAVVSWDLYRFVCVMKDNTIQLFTGMCDETADGEINKNFNCVNDDYEWDFDDIVMWIEVPSTK